MIGQIKTSKGCQAREQSEMVARWSADPRQIIYSEHHHRTADVLPESLRDDPIWTFLCVPVRVDILAIPRVPFIIWLEQRPKVCGSNFRDPSIFRVLEKVEIANKEPPATTVGVRCFAKKGGREVELRAARGQQHPCDRRLEVYVAKRDTVGSRHLEQSSAHWAVPKRAGTNPSKIGIRGRDNVKMLRHYGDDTVVDRAHVN